MIEICSRSCVTCIVGRLCTVARCELRTAHLVCGLALHNPCACWPACVFGSCGVLVRAVFQKPNTARHSCALHVEAPSWTDGPGVFTSEFGPSHQLRSMMRICCRRSQLWLLWSCFTNIRSLRGSSDGCVQCHKCSLEHRSHRHGPPRH